LEPLKSPWYSSVANAKTSGYVQHLVQRTAEKSIVDAKPAANEPSPFDDGDLYDILMQDVRYGIDFYLQAARESKGPVLDICCGTGRILLPCMQAGADVDGLDLSQAILDTLRKKAASLQLAPRLYRADMSDFELPRRYALVMITFNAFIHNLTQSAQIR
jgi:2-polyprenyl-3-methyl-5-hydroxy-6-metoxy-1,4-benzoquinol methylase